MLHRLLDLVSVARSARKAQVGSLSERRGDFVRFFSPSQASDRDRIGKPHTLPFGQSRFRDAISAKAKWEAHSSILEAHGLLLAVKWLLRTPVNFNRRLVVLVDAKAVLGAASKVFVEFFATLLASCWQPTACCGWCMCRQSTTLQTPHPVVCAGGPHAG